MEEGERRWGRKEETGEGAEAEQLCSKLQCQNFICLNTRKCLSLESKYSAVLAMYVHDEKNRLYQYAPFIDHFGISNGVMETTLSFLSGSQRLPL